MGDPRKPRKKYRKPFKRWDKARILEENALRRTYGLKNDAEIWRTRAVLRRIRANARALLAASGEERAKREKELLGRLYRLGLLPENATLDDVLTLDIRDLLERRLQTVVWRKGLARTVKQARQLIVHGHVYVGERRVTVPSYWVRRGEEDLIRVDQEVYEAIMAEPVQAPVAEPGAAAEAPEAPEEAEVKENG